MTSGEMIDKIRKTEAEMQTAGPIHRRDLGRHLKRMQRELRDYDRFQAAAKRKVG